MSLKDQLNKIDSFYMKESQKSISQSAVRIESDPIVE